jgi:ABC-2 type transport system ATP-binding protein
LLSVRSWIFLVNIIDFDQIKISNKLIAKLRTFIFAFQPSNIPPFNFSIFSSLYSSITPSFHLSILPFFHFRIQIPKSLIQKGFPLNFVKPFFGSFLTKLKVFFLQTENLNVEFMDIVVENLTKVYGAQRAVDDITFRVKTGEVLGFLGPNGAGKTTTMKAITTYLNPTNGDIHVGEFSIHEKPGEIKKRIGYLPESNPLYQDMAIIDYLKYVARLQGIESAKVDDRIRDMVNICGLEGEKHKKISELSKGYRQRVGLAQALIHDPEVLILDEPTSGLDPNQIVEIRELIKKIGREKTVILSSHILAEVEATCDRIMIINKGKIVADGSADELRKHAQGKEILRVKIEDAEHDEIFEKIQELASVELVDFINKNTNLFEVQSKKDLSSRKDIFKLCVKNKWILTEMSPIETKLEDVFRELTIK